LGKKPSCKLREAFGGRKNLPASCGRLSVGKKTFLQVALDLDDGVEENYKLFGKAVYKR